MKPRDANVQQADRTPSGRLGVLDAFRAVAILAVVAFHYLRCWAPPGNAHNLYGYHQTYSHWLSLGNLGVQFFFMISGFVILMTLESCRTLPEFWFRRFARLYPAYIVVLLSSYVLSNSLGPAEISSTPADLLGGIGLVLPNLFGGTFVDLAFWSLLVEAQFYALVGVLFTLGRQRFVPAWIVLVTAGLVCWLLGGWTGWQPLTLLRHPFFLLPHAAYFSAGMGFYRLYKQETAQGIALLALAIVAYVIVNFSAAWSTHLVCLAMVLAFALFLSGRLRLLERGPLPPLGEISYSLYLVHQNLGLILIAGFTRIGTPDLLAAAAALAVSTGVAYALNRSIEGPAKQALLRWARGTQWWRSRQLAF